MEVDREDVCHGKDGTGAGSGDRALAKGGGDCRGMPTPGRLDPPVPGIGWRDQRHQSPSPGAGPMSQQPQPEHGQNHNEGEALRDGCGWCGDFPTFGSERPRRIREMLFAFLPDDEPQQVKAWDESIPPIQSEVSKTVDREPKAPAYSELFKVSRQRRRPSLWSGLLGFEQSCPIGAATAPPVSRPRHSPHFRAACRWPDR